MQPHFGEHCPSSSRWYRHFTLEMISARREEPAVMALPNKALSAPDILLKGKETYLPKSLSRARRAAENNNLRRVELLFSAAWLSEGLFFCTFFQKEKQEKSSPRERRAAENNNWKRVELLFSAACLSEGLCVCRLRERKTRKKNALLGNLRRNSKTHTHSG